MQDVAETRGVSDKAAEEQKGHTGEAFEAGISRASGIWPGPNRQDPG